MRVHKASEFARMGGRDGAHFQVSHWTRASGMSGLDPRGTKVLRMRTLQVWKLCSNICRVYT